MGIIGAMDVEIALLREEMAKAGAVKITRIAGMEFNVGTIGNATVIVVQCGVGMVNAATCAQVLVDRFGVGALLNTGIAGSLDASINIGDIVVADDAVNHIMDVCNLGYAAGQTPGLDTMAFPCSPALSKSVVAAASAIGATTHTGRVASGDRFVAAHHRNVRREVLRDGRRGHRAGRMGQRRAVRHRARHLRQGRRLLVHGLPHVRGAGSPQQCRARHRHA